MAKGKSSKQHKIGHANFVSNKQRKIKKEINKAEKKLKKLLRLFEEGRKRNCKDKIKTTQGIRASSKRHEALKSHIAQLKGKL